VSIILKQGGQVSLLRSGEFNVESEMESLVAHHPDLLQSEADPELRLVARQVSLGEAGLLDVLLVSEDGLPIAVETKLGSNGESRRELVAQAVDYISSMTQFTNDELDRVCGGRLELALRAFDSEGADSTAGSFERRWQALGANLRAGLARLVLVLDQAPASLVRMVRFLAENSQLDVQLVVLERHLTDGNGGHEVVVPRVLVSAESLQRRATVQKEPRPKLKEVVDLYNRDAPPELAALGACRSRRLFQLPAD
jgi:hypothetical protein